MKDVILIAILLLIVGGIFWYLYRAKRRGVHCVGCPHQKSCSKHACCSDKETV